MKKCLAFILIMVICLSLTAGCNKIIGNITKKAPVNKSNTPTTSTTSPSTTESPDIISVEPNPESENEKNPEPTSESEQPATPISEINIAPSATFESPTPFGSAYVWSGTKETTAETYEYKYTYAVKNVKPLTAAEIEEFNLKVNDDDRLEYKIVDVFVSADIKLTSRNEGGSLYLTYFLPSLIGSTASDGSMVIGGIDYGFEGSLRKSLQTTANSKKISVGQSGSYSVEGKIILPVIKGEKSYLTLRSDSGEKLYFSLE